MADDMELSVESGGGRPPRPPQIGLVGLFFACMVAGGVQYGWALQLSLLTPYVQTLGIPHALTSVMWLCGPIAGLIVQPCVGLSSDKCASPLGRRRPFILSGCIVICISVIVVGFSSDIGYALGDTKEDCKDYTGPRYRAAAAFILGFWLLDFSNNTVQGPARAMMADLSGKHGPSVANAIFVSWMAIGNILGYSSGSTDKWHQWFPALQTRACCEACANLKAAFLVAVIFLGFSTVVTMIFAKETPLDLAAAKQSEGEATGPLAVLKGMKNLPPGMAQVLIVTGLTWLSWFPFILFDTDWMGREMYHGRPDGNPAEIAAFQEGVRQGAFGLLLNSVLLGMSSFTIEPMCRKLGPRTVWVVSQVLVCISMALVAILGSWSLGDFGGNVQDAAAREKGLKASALALFVFLGLPFAVLCSVPFAVTAQLAASKGGGQGLCTGVLNIAIVVPQMVIAIGAGPWDELFGKGNIPAFALASVFAFGSAVAGMIMLPKMPKSSFRSVSMGGGHAEIGREQEENGQPHIALSLTPAPLSVLSGSRNGIDLGLPPPPPDHAGAAPLHPRPAASSFPSKSSLLSIPGPPGLLPLRSHPQASCFCISGVRSVPGPPSLLSLHAKRAWPTTTRCRPLSLRCARGS